MSVSGGAPHGLLEQPDATLPEAVCLVVQFLGLPAYALHSLAVATANVMAEFLSAVESKPEDYLPKTSASSDCLNSCNRKILLDNDTVFHTVCYIQYTRHSTRRPMNPEVIENLKLELRRGCLILAVLAELRTERYGYTLRKALSEQGLEIDEGTLYPLLRRLESQDLLVSEWREEDKRNKRFYRLSPDGKAILKQLVVEWKGISTSLEGIL
jgi:PadR family transcriptional regulator PadR